ncbi:MAG: ABC transporter permease [Burkholderiaceae bacterium]|nr:ABC transporter permease [Burkholderiaceae bacterium]MCD8517157.1 ABC transporter permease [Burkholderiaceae bacterium]MCD8536580.1 ABC transporter permease [Burkholderiaceae bacterium]
MWIEFNIALKFLRQGFAQTLLILIGIGVGVAVIVFITTLVGGLQKNIVDRTLGTQAHIRVEPYEEVNRQATIVEGVRQIALEDKRSQQLRSINNWQQIMTALEALPDVTAVSPVVSGPAFARRGAATMSVSVIGIDPVRYERIISISDDIISGQFRVGAGDTVIGSKLASDLGLRVGSKLRLEASGGRTAVVTITGIFDLGVRELDSRFVYLDLKQAQALLGLYGGVTVIDLTVKDIFDASRVSDQIDRLTNLKSESWMQINSQLMNALQSQSLSSSLISFFVALSVAFGIASVLAISVTQRTREIGILRAMGARKEQMLRVFLIQGAILGLFGSFAGAGVGWGMVWIFNEFGPRLFDIKPSATIIPVAVSIATITGVVAAIAPAWRASRLDPVAAIRYV